MTQGRGVFSMEISHFEETPKSVQEEIIGNRASKS
jgi:elongation factor G